MSVLFMRGTCLFARRARAGTSSSLGFWRLDNPTKFRDRGLFRSSNFSHVTANRFCQDFFIDTYLVEFVPTTFLCTALWCANSCIDRTTTTQNVETNVCICSTAHGLFANIKSKENHEMRAPNEL
jgi:hypothetical protein